MLGKPITPFCRLGSKLCPAFVCAILTVLVLPAAGFPIGRKIQRSWGYDAVPENILVTNKFQRQRLLPATRTNIPLALNLFAFNNREDGKRSSRGEVEESVPTSTNETLNKDDTLSFLGDADLNGWISGLRQWPLNPKRYASIQDENNEKVLNSNADSLKTIQVNNNPPLRRMGADEPSSFPPLTRILNMEALLAFATRREDTQSVESTAFLLSSTKNMTSVPNNSGDLSSVALLEDLSSWDKWMGSLRLNIGDFRSPNAESSSPGGPVASSSTSAGPSRSGDFLRQATSRIEALVVDASSVISPTTIQTLLKWASETIQNQKAADNLVETAQEVALGRGLNVSEAAERARGATAFTLDLVTVADGILRKGYVAGDPIPDRKQDFLLGIPAVSGSRALFADYPLAVELNTLSPIIAKDAEMGALAGAVYSETVARAHALGHTIVARGITEDVRWMITDSVANATSFRKTSGAVKPFLVRTITIRGFDASDEEVDREKLVNRVCTATPERVPAGEGVLLHSGLHEIAKSIYKGMQQYID